MNSRSKGQRGELEFCKLLEAAGFPACRNDQSRGGADNPDLFCGDLDAYHLEIKRTERLDLYGSLAQAASDSGDRKPVLAFRRNHGRWYVVLRAEDWLERLKQESPTEKAP